MPDKPCDDDIRDVMAEEKSRGKRPIDLKARKEKAQLLRQVREALGWNTEAEFRQEAVRLWRSFSSSRRK